MTADPAVREVRTSGRPRLFSEEAIHTAVHRVICREGYPNFTLEQVAQDVGCSRQALIRRYGSKRAMVFAAVSASSGQISENFGPPDALLESPLETLRARLVRPPNSRPDDASTRRESANLLAFVLDSAIDPEFAKMFNPLIEIAIGHIEQCLAAAVERAELEPVDTAALAIVLQAAWTGTTVYIATEETHDHANARAVVFDQIVGPYRRSPA